jgi:hypothetical protein
MEPFDEARKVLTPRAIKTNTAVTLAIGYRRGYSTEFVRRSGTGVDRGITALFHIIRKTKGAHHIAIGFTLRVDITDVLFAVWARIAKLQANGIYYLWRPRTCSKRLRCRQSSWLPHRARTADVHKPRKAERDREAGPGERQEPSREAGTARQSKK